MPSVGASAAASRAPGVVVRALPGALARSVLTPVLVVTLLLLAGSLRAYPPPISMEKRFEQADIVLVVQLKRVVVLENRGPSIRAEAHLLIDQVLKGSLRNRSIAVALHIVPASEEGDLLRAPASGNYIVLLSRRGDALSLYSPAVYGLIPATDSNLRRFRLLAQP